jgi:chloramphenicol 3-O-phosphotransferase
LDVRVTRIVIGTEEERARTQPFERMVARTDHYAIGDGAETSDRDIGANLAPTEIREPAHVEAWACSYLAIEANWRLGVDIIQYPVGVNTEYAPFCQQLFPHFTSACLPVKASSDRLKERNIVQKELHFGIHTLKAL